MDTRKQAEALIEQAVWWRFACNYNENDWPENPRSFIFLYYRQGLEEVYDEEHKKRIILWYPYTCFSKEKLLEAILDYQYDLEYILPTYAKIVNPKIKHTGLLDKIKNFIKIKVGV